MDSRSEPRVSIITATHNVRSGFARTAASVRAQAYPGIQWIVIDGASTDGTVNEITSNADIIDFWLSEPDKSIYEAWNKGCEHIRGTWVLFLGAGDELAPNAIEEIVPYLDAAEGQHEIVYGKIQLVDPAGNMVSELGADWSSMKGKWGGMLPLMPPHPAFFHHSSIFSGRNSFSPALRFAGDSGFVVKSVLRNDPLFVPLVVDRMLTGGISVNPRNILKVAAERRMIAESNSLKPPMLHTILWRLGVWAQFFFYVVLPKPVRRIVRVPVYLARLLFSRAVVG